MSLMLFGAGEESRTLDLNLGKVALYQLSYSRFALPDVASCCLAAFRYVVINNRHAL
jgi:hypothetical protein